MVKNSIRFIIFLGLLILAIPALANEIETKSASDQLSAKKEELNLPFMRRPDEEIVTKLGTVKVGMPKDMLYKIFQNQDRIFSHKILGGEWIVFRNWTSANPKTDVITFYLSDGLVTGWKDAFVPSPKNEGSVYEYKSSDSIREWFFPAGKSRWNGTDMSVQEWNMLTDTQKVLFLAEYMKEVEKEEGAHISIDTSKYLLAINYYADTCSTAYISKKITDVIRSLLVSEGKIEGEPVIKESPALQKAEP